MLKIAPLLDTEFQVLTAVGSYKDTHTHARSRAQHAGAALVAITKGKA